MKLQNEELVNQILRELPSREALEVERSRRASRSLAGFIREAWHILEPEDRLVWGWALDALCEHLEAITSGDIKRLLANVPPGMMKSLAFNVFFPAWEWGPKELTHHRFIGASHNFPLSIRDNRKCRNLIASDWYQQRWPHVELTVDQNAKVKFENTRTGFREVMAFTSMTGNRGHRAFADDPHTVLSAESDAQREDVILNFRESFPSRRINSDSALAIIMQRLHEQDVSGEIIAEGLDYVHLCLPMEFEEARRCTTVIGFTDPRTEEGELLFPERFDEDEVERLTKALGPYAAAGQLQQRPEPRGGGAFDKDNWQYLDTCPELIHVCRGWDLAASSASTRAQRSRNARTAGVKMGIDRSGRVVISHVAKGHWTPGVVEDKMQSISQVDGLSVVQDFPQDPGQAGKAQRRALAAVLAGHIIHSSVESGDKGSRAAPLQAQQEAGNVFLVRGPWNDSFVKEASVFPVGSQRDQIDAASRAYARLLLLRESNVGGVAAPIVVELNG